MSIKNKIREIIKRDIADGKILPSIPKDGCRPDHSPAVMRVFKFIRDNAGATDAELQFKCGMNHNTARWARYGLGIAGYIRDSGLLRGSSKIWIVTDKEY